MQNVMKKLFLLLLVLAALSAQAERKFLTSAPHPQTGQVKTWSYEADEITTGDVFSVMVYLDGQQYGRWNVTAMAASGLLGHKVALASHKSGTLMGRQLATILRLAFASLV